MRREPQQGGIFRQHKFFWIIFLIVILILGIHHFTSLNTRLRSSWNKIIYTSSNRVSIAVYSPKTHRIYTATNASHHHFHTASTVKVSILVGILMKQNGTLTSQQKSLAKAMIEESDNASTTELFNNSLGGRSGLQATFNKLGMKDSVAKNEWGLTTTTPRDQIKLLNNVFYHSSLLNSNGQKIVKDLMSNVDSDQNWGISAGSKNFAVKNGWLSYDSDNWIVNSIGYIKNKNGSSYTIAVYTDNNSSMDTGQQTIEQLARATKPLMK